MCKHGFRDKRSSSIASNYCCGKWKDNTEEVKNKAGILTEAGENVRGLCTHFRCPQFGLQHKHTNTQSKYLRLLCIKFSAANRSIAFLTSTQSANDS